MKISILAVCAAFSVQGLLAQTTGVNLDSGSEQVFDEDTAASNPLSGGTTADGDGFVLRLGYFSNATVDNWFAGTFIPLTGEGAANTGIIPDSSPSTPYNRTSIGDVNLNGAGDGTFFMSLSFSPGTMTGNNLPPSSGIPLSIQFYNGTTIAGSTHFNYASNNLWQWQTPATPPATVNVSLSDPNVVWFSIVVEGQPPNSAFHTAVLIPEPSTYALFAVGLAGAAIAGRRRLKLVA